MKTVFVNECAADGCYKKNMGKGKQMCQEHEKMYEEGQPFKAFYGKTVLKKEYQSKQLSSTEPEESEEAEDVDFTPCSKCDGHQACEDFGCAIEHGLEHLLERDPTDL